MQEFDLWLDANVVGPLESAAGTTAFESVAKDVKKALRIKMLQSYHNGQSAGPRAVKQAERGGR